MKIKKRYIILVALFLVYFSTRMFFSVKSMYFRDDSSYFALDQIKYIAETGLPKSFDELSYGGRTHLFMPFYYYFMGLAYWISPSILFLKIINNLLASTLIIGTYLLASKLITNRKISLFIAILTASMPIYIKDTLHNLGPSSIIFPSIVFLIYYFLNLEKDSSSLNLLLPFSFIIVLSTPYSSMIAFAFVLYVLLNYLENRSISNIEKEYIFFFLFFYLWANLIIFKQSFQMHGFSALWQNLPGPLLDTYFFSLNIGEIFTSIGFFPLVSGSYVIYRYTLKKKSKNIAFITSIAAASLSLMFSRFVPPEVALALLGIMLSVLLGVFIKEFFLYFSKTKFEGKKNIVYISIIGIVIATQIIPSIFVMYDSLSNIPSREYVDAFLWLRDNAEEDATIVASPVEGYFVTYFAEKKNVLDRDYVLISDADGRFEDLKRVYTGSFKVESIRILDKYSATYLILSEKAKLFYGIENINYVEDNDECFDLVYDKGTKIYRWDQKECGLKTL